MEAKEVISLLDSYWYSHKIFKKTTSTCTINPSSPSKNSIPIPPHKFQEKSPKIFNQSSNHKRSSSDQMMNTSSKSLVPSPPIESPNSVLQVIKKEKVVDDSFSRRTRPYDHLKKKRSLSKSLSELEFQEVKGFMDLGFVFSEEDKEITSLVEIIPGLQRILGNTTNTNSSSSSNKEEYGGDCVDNEKCLMISRPYLSEAWEDDLDNRKTRRVKENPLINWRIPNVNDEINMKDNLKWWAQAVASTVK